VKPNLSAELPPLRILLVLDNLTGNNSPDQIIAWFAAVAAHWNEAPTPFEWGGERQRRRQR
jgi:hypothetical protein